MANVTELRVALTVQDFDWIGGSSPSSKVPSSPTRTTAETGWFRGEEPAVKYISCARAPGR